MRFYALLSVLILSTIHFVWADALISVLANDPRISQLATLNGWEVLVQTSCTYLRGATTGQVVVDFTITVPTGGYFSAHFLRASDGANAQISLNGVPVTNLATAAAGLIWSDCQETSYVSGGLAAGTYRVTINRADLTVGSYLRLVRFAYYGLPGAPLPGGTYGPVVASTTAIVSTPTTATQPAVSSTGPPTIIYQKSNAGAIAGGVVGGIVALALIGLIIFLLLRRKPQPQPNPVPAPQPAGWAGDGNGKGWNPGPTAASPPPMYPTPLSPASMASVPLPYIPNASQLNQEQLRIVQDLSNQGVAPSVIASMVDQMTTQPHWAPSTEVINARTA